MSGARGETVSVRVASSLPPANAEWNVDLGDDPETAMIYTNLAYDLIAAAMAKLGVEMSKYILDGNRAALEESMVEVQDALRSGVVGASKKK